MAIISISIDGDLLGKIDSLQKEFDFSGRSDLFRAAIANLENELRQKQNLTGTIDAVLIIVHSGQTQEVSKIIHKYSSLVKTQMHGHTTSKKCQELFFLSGDSKKIKQLSFELTKNRKIEIAKLIIN